MKGDSVTHKLHTSYGVGKVKSSVLATGSTSVYWPDNDHTTVQGSHVLRNKKWKNTVSQQEEPEHGRRDRSKAENAKIREDRYALAIGNRVKHAHHKAFGIGRVSRRRTFGHNEYRWDIRWNDGRKTTNGADYLISLDGGPIQAVKKEVKQKKHPNPNRSWRERKSKDQVFGGDPKRCCYACDAKLPGGGYGEPGDPRRWCHNCFRARREQSARLAMRNSLQRANPDTNVRTKMATAKQLRAIAMLATDRGVSASTDMQSLSFHGADVLIASWDSLPDLTLPTGPYTASTIQKRVVRELERRIGMPPLNQQSLDAHSIGDASQLIQTLQETHDEAR
jgi:hypothetical protein